MSINLTIPSAAVILQQLLNDYQAVTTQYGYSVSIDPGSELAIRYSSLANQIAVLYYQALQQFQSQMPDSATGSDLDRLANQFGIFRRGATSAQGFAALIAAAPQTLTTAMTLTASNGLSYQVSQTGIYQPGSNFPIVSIDQGSNTNLAPPAVLTWSIGIPPLTQNTCPVTVALTGGQDVEDDTTFRNRLLLTLQNPPQSGNASSLIQLAQGVDTLIQAAFIYPNYNGAGTQLIALAGYQTTSYIGRDLPHLANDNSLSLNLQSPVYNQYTLPNSVNNLSNPNFGEFNDGNTLANDTSAVYGQLAATVGNIYATAVTTVNNLPINLAFTLSLPYPVGAAYNGRGNGWNNFTTWPNPDGYWVGGLNLSGYHVPQIVSVTGNVSATPTTPAGFEITIAAATGSTASISDGKVPSPTANVTQINWINRSDSLETGWQVVQATILNAVNNGDNTWTLILDTPLTFSSTGATQTDNMNAATGTLTYSRTLSFLPVPGLLTVNVNGSIIGSDNGAGVISGSFGGQSMSGTVNYSTGAISITFNVAGAPVTGQTITFSYTIATTDFYGDTGAVAGDYIFPASANAQTYLTNVLQNFALLGPGQVTNSLGLLALGAGRVPSLSQAYQTNITSQFDKNLESNSEVYSASIYYNQATDTTFTYYNTVNPGQPPASAPPGIWIPRNISFYSANDSNYQ
jgi:uncharacterized phage protein gp47/JayE